MKERPILFSAPMVRAILDGHKTQTRRVVKGVALAWLTPHGFGKEFVALPENQFCPYGYPGDRIWVRETHAPQPDCWGAWDNWMLLDKKGPKPIIHYAADGGDPWIDRWRPSIHMPRWASRITLEVTGVRIERLNDISEEDANAEGVQHSLHLQGGRYASENYAHLWWQINGDGAWELNPWVWVVEFRRVNP